MWINVIRQSVISIPKLLLGRSFCLILKAVKHLKDTVTQAEAAINNPQNIRLSINLYEEIFIHAAMLIYLSMLMTDGNLERKLKERTDKESR